MITQFNIFESKLKPTSRAYWLIPTDERLSDSLKEIMKDDFDEDFITFISKINAKYVYVGHIPGSNNIEWSYCRYEKPNYYKNKGCKFLGPVNIPNYELTANKYNI
jgi:hypothetical protein